MKVLSVLRKSDKYYVKQKERLSPILIERQLEQEIGLDTYVFKKAIETARDRGMLKMQTCIYSHDQLYTCRRKLYKDRQLKIYMGKIGK